MEVNVYGFIISVRPTFRTLIEITDCVAVKYPVEMSNIHETHYYRNRVGT